MRRSDFFDFNPVVEKLKRCASMCLHNLTALRSSPLIYPQWLGSADETFSGIKFVGYSFSSATVLIAARNAQTSCECHNQPGRPGERFAESMTSVKVRGLNPRLIRQCEPSLGSFTLLSCTSLCILNRLTTFYSDDEIKTCLKDKNKGNSSTSTIYMNYKAFCKCPLCL